MNNIVPFIYFYLFCEFNLHVTPLNNRGVIQLHHVGVYIIVGPFLTLRTMSETDECIFRTDPKCSDIYLSFG